ncbi:MAG: slipin family protein [Planctomycetota bacterium]
MIRRIFIGNQERGFLYQFASFYKYLTPGNHWFFDPFYRIQIFKISTKIPKLTHTDAQIFLKNPDVQKDLKLIEIQDTQCGFLFFDGRFQEILAPGKYGFFQDIYKVDVEIIEVKTPEFEHEKLDIILNRANYQNFLEVCQVIQNHVALMIFKGKYIKTLSPGRYVFWRTLGELKFVHVRIGDQQIDISGQEIMTLDKVTLRMNVHCTYQINDPVKTALEVDQSRDILYREIQLICRQEVASRKLDDLLTEREKLAEALLQGIQARALELGYRVKSIGLRDIILPGEMKTILNQVVEAEKKAQANLIRHREETSATRSLLNTAKLMENNPILLRLKELEILTEVASHIGTIQVVGGLGALLNQLKIEDIPLLPKKEIP